MDVVLGYEFLRLCKGTNRQCKMRNSGMLFVDVHQDISAPGNIGWAEKIEHYATRVLHYDRVPGFEPNVIDKLKSQYRVKIYRSGLVTNSDSNVVDVRDIQHGYYLILKALPNAVTLFVEILPR